MATVNKDFKIKSGLIVEGLQGTINGEVILTENASDQYILNLIGGETLVKSVSSDFYVDENGLLEISEGSDLARTGDITSSINNLTTSDIEEGSNLYFTAQRAIDAGDGVFDAYGAASTAQTNAQNYADGLAVNYDPAGAAATAESNAEFYTDNAIGNLGGSGTASVEGNIDVLTGTGIQVNGGNNSVEIDRQTVDTWYDAAGAAATAEQNANLYTDNAVADLVNGAPELLDTLNELAAALEDNPDVIADLRDIADGKQDTLTAGSNIDITGATISVTGLDTADVAEDASRLYFTNQRAVDAQFGLWDTEGAAAQALSDAQDYADGLAANYDAAGSAATAEQNAKDYADALDTDDVAEGSINEYFTDARAKASAASLLTGASLTNITITGTGAGLTITAENGVGDSTTDDLEEGSTNLYFTDARAQGAINDTTPNFAAVEIDLVAKQIAAQTDAPTAGIQIAHAFAKADYRSAEYLVKVAYGAHTEISKVLLTLDSSDNISITEYGVVGTNGSASTISASISGANVQLQVTTVNNNSTVTVMGTLLA